MEFINDLMTYHFLQNALVTAVVIGIVSGAIGYSYQNNTQR